ncbi:MAG TPA: sigma-70 family RNA polymerase sigma factor [Kofleriaceae bacterium]|jgi:RNA polymerase sigma-70 factor (ECF subfamily)|nr:sigma-70 family RNA polymerase sigma factor [Kofleriaceae bacterium]
MQLDEAIAPERADDPDQDVRDLIAVREHTRALRLLMQRHGAALYRFCREALRDATLADDVHQQVFIEAYRDFDRYGGRSTLRTWLFAIARHRCLDAAKGRTRWTSRFKNEAGDELSDPHPTAGERIDDARLRSSLETCLDELGEHVRTAVLLRYQQGFSFEDMSSVCREKAGTLQARVSRALPVLRACIEKKTGGAL